MTIESDLAALTAGFQPDEGDQRRRLGMFFATLGLNGMQARKGFALQDWAGAGNAALGSMNQYDQMMAQRRSQAMQQASQGMDLLTKKRAYDDDAQSREILRSVSARFAGGGAPQAAPGGDYAKPMQTAFAAQPGAIANTAGVLNDPAGTQPDINTATPALAPQPHQVAQAIDGTKRRIAQYNALADAYSLAGQTNQAMLYDKAARELQPKLKEMLKVAGPDGSPMYQKVYENGTDEATNMREPVKLEHVDSGGSNDWFNPYNTKMMGSTPKTMTPHEQFMAPIEEGRFKNDTARLGIERGQFGIAQQRLGLDQQRLGNDNQRLSFELAGGNGQLEKDSNGNFVRVRGAEATPVLQNGQPVRAQPQQGLQEKLAQNAVNIANIDAALAEINKHPESVGPSNMLPFAETWKQFTDSKGTDVRAIVAGIGGQKFHDLSGAAVSVSEASRLKPYIPGVGDRPAVVVQKLNNLRREMALMQQQLAQGMPLLQVITAPATGRFAGFSAQKE